MAKKGAMPVFETADDYINSQSEKAQKVLSKLRNIILTAVPEAIEIKNSKVPSYILVPGKKPNQQIMIAAYSKYVSFYPYQGAIDYFSSELEGFDIGKGTIKFSFDQDIPEELIKKMIKFRKEEISNSN
jgi:uncharacterized protein YdhG (YjbR/CyaY superfamily)